MIHIISGWARNQPDKLAAIYNGTPVTYAQFAHAIVSMSQHLRKSHLPQNQTAIVVVRNILDAWVACIALRGIGLNTVCVNSTAEADSLNLDNVCCIVSIEGDIFATRTDPTPGCQARQVVLPKPEYSANKLFNEEVAEKATVQGGHMLYTSGTTGAYKKLFFSAALQEASNAVGCLEYTQESIYHCLNLGLWTGVGFKFPQRLWRAGGSVIFEQRDDWYRYFLNAGMTHALLMPFMANQLLDWCEDKASSATKKDFSLALSGGFLPYQQAEKLLDCVSDNLVNIFGITELNGTALSAKINAPEDLLWLCPAEGRAIQIVDDNDIPCSTGQQGHLRIRLLQQDFDSYLDDPDSSARFFRDGYFYPGDMAVASADGRIQPLGRKLDVLNVAGTKIASAPLELDLQKTLGVDTVCLFTGIDSAGQDELVVAVRTDTMPPESDVKQALSQLQMFQNVRFAFARAFPLTKSGTQKTDRVELRRLLFPVE